MNRETRKFIVGLIGFFLCAFTTVIYFDQMVEGEFEASFRTVATLIFCSIGSIYWGLYVNGTIEKKK